MKIRKLSPIRKTIPSNTDKEEIDLCLVCEEDLYFDEEYTRRIGIYDYNPDKVRGWMCPYCKSEFDRKDNIVTLLSSIMQEGES